MKECLFISITDDPTVSNPGIDQLASYLRMKGHTVDILYFHNGESIEDMYNSIPKDYRIYGFSVYELNRTRCYTIARDIKLNFKDSLICFGGQFVTYLYRDILEEFNYIDYLVIGDGEEPFEYLLTNYNDHSKILENPHIISRDSINKEVSVKRNFTVNWKQCEDYYLSRPYNPHMFYYLQTKSNTCSGRCSFCLTVKSKDENVYYKPIGEIADEIEYMNKKHKIDIFRFSDDDIMDPDISEAKSRIEEICAEIDKRALKIHLGCLTKANSFKYNDYDISLLRRMKNSGFHDMTIGIETGNQQDLKLYNKKASLEDNYNIIMLLRECGIEPRIGFIFINPYSTPETLADNFTYLKKIQAVNLDNYIFSQLTAYKYTPIYNKIMKDGLFTGEYTYGNIQKYRFINSQVNEIVEFLDRTFRRELNKYVTIESLRRDYVVFKNLYDLSSLDRDINRLMNEYRDVYNGYFYHLYVKFDLSYCNANYSEIKNFIIEKSREVIRLRNKMTKIIIASN